MNTIVAAFLGPIGLLTYTLFLRKNRLTQGRFVNANEERDYKIATGAWSQEQEDFYLETRTWGVHRWDTPEMEAYYGAIRTKPLRPYTEHR